MAGCQTVDSEERQGKALIDESVSVKQGVRFFVYPSVDRGSEWSPTKATYLRPLFRSRYKVEKPLLEKTQSDEMGWTILRPTAFFDAMVQGKVFAAM